MRDKTNHVPMRLRQIVSPAWEAQPGETPINFAQFIAYRDLGAKRTIAHAARVMGMSLHGRGDRPEPNFASGSVGMTASAMRWRERALAWDSHLQRLRDESARAAARKESAKRARLWERRRQDSLEDFYAISQKARIKASAMLDAPAYDIDIETAEDGTVTKTLRPKFGFSDVARLMKVSAEIQAACLMAATRDIDSYSEDELRAISSDVEIDPEFDGNPGPAPDPELDQIEADDGPELADPADGPGDPEDGRGPDGDGEGAG